MLIRKILAFSIVFIAIHFSLASAQVNDTADSSYMADPNIFGDMPDQTNSTSTNQTNSTSTNQTNSTSTNQTNSTAYTLPNSTSVVDIIPKVTTIDPKSSQVLSTHLLDKLISRHGQSGVGRVVTDETNSSLANYKIIADSAEGFGNVGCSHGTGYALMTGQYTSGVISYKVIFLQMSLLDNAGHVLATGNGLVSDIDANTTKSFNAIARFNGNFTSCTIQTDNAIPK
ncbi:MAG TPA: hypothetical protein VFG24_05175 [Nitrosopumilaceae archaeon]|nr:hypothetical protein [Nitrosopumilaceae archaeon]